MSTQSRLRPSQEARLARPRLMHAMRYPAMVVEPLADLFRRLAEGSLRVVEGETYPLSQARPRPMHAMRFDALMK